MTLLSELLAASDTGPADQLRKLAQELQAELPDGSYPEHRPRSSDVLLTASLPYSDGAVRYVVLRLEHSETAAIDLYERRCPFNYTDTHVLRRLWTGSLVLVGAVGILQRFVGEARLFNARGVA